MKEFAYFIIKLLILCIIAPMITFIHELGHAIAGLILTKGDVVIQLGKETKIIKSKTIKFRRLKIKLNCSKCFLGQASYWDCNIKENDRFILALSGPLMSLILLILLFLINFLGSGKITKITSVMIICDFYLLVCSLIPRVDPYALNKGNTTDGYKIKEYLKQKK